MAARRFAAGRSAAKRFSETPAERAYRRQVVEETTFEIVPLKSASEAIAALPSASSVSVTCSPVKGIDATIELVDQVRAAGHTVTPHIAARMVESNEHLARIASWLRTEAIGRVFVVGGDAEEPHGPFADGLSLLEALLDADPGLQEVGVPSYPDGHPLIDGGVLDEALHAKQAVLAEAGVAGWASTQMCFDTDTIYGWLTAQREAGLELPVHLGIAGVVERSRLLTMGARLGVGTSLRFLRKNRRAVLRLMSTNHYDPNQLLEPLSPAFEPLRVTGLHCFTFNQVDATATWRASTIASL